MQTPLGELTALPRPSSWISDVLLLREGRGGKGGGKGKREGKGGEGKGGEGKEGGSGRKGRKGEGKTLWICSPRKNFLATPLNIVIGLTVYRGATLHFHLPTVLVFYHQRGD